MPQEKKEPSLLSRGIVWMKASLPVMAGQTIGEHLSERIKNPKQVMPERSYSWHITEGITRKGWKGFFLDGATANSIRVFGRHLWRNPALLLSKNRASHILPEETQQAHPNLAKYIGFGGVIISDIVIATPLERIKTIQMTEPGNKATDALTLARKLPWKELYKGWHVLGLRQSLYFSVTTLGEELAKKWSGDNQLSWKQKTTSAFLSSITYVAASMIPDVIKTRMQMHNSPYDTAGAALKAIAETFQKDGIKSGMKTMCAGFWARVALCSFSTFANYTVFSNTLSSQNLPSCDIRIATPHIDPLIPPLQKSSPSFQEPSTLVTDVTVLTTHEKIKSSIKRDEGNMR